MRFLIHFILIAICTVFMASCDAPRSQDSEPVIIDGHNSQNALDWDGVYRGVLPCADCEGIQYVVVLNQDESFDMLTRYLGREGRTDYTRGTFIWSKDGGKITLRGDEPRHFQVGENMLFALDMEGQRITGKLAQHYQLTKVPDVSLLEHYWKLVLLNGQPIDPVDRDAYIVLKNDGTTVKGSGGCNGLGGTYHHIDNTQKLHFGDIMMTEMACAQGMDVEQKFAAALAQVESFKIHGDILSLYNEAAHEIARLEAVFLY